MVKHRHILRFSEYDADADPISYWAMSVAGIAIVEDSDPYWRLRYALRTDKNSVSGFSNGYLAAYVEPVPYVSMNKYGFNTTVPPTWAPESFTPSNGDDISSVLTLSGGGPWGLSVPAQSTPSVDVLGYLYEFDAAGKFLRNSSFYSAILTYGSSRFKTIRVGSTVTGAMLLDYKRGGYRYYANGYANLAKTSWTLEEVQNIELNWVVIYNSRAFVGSGSMRAS